MAPSAKTLTNALRSAVSETFYSDDRDQLSITFARKRAVRALKLQENFFTESEWKAKSKQIVKDLIEELLALEEANGATSQKSAVKEARSDSDDAAGKKSEPKVAKSKAKRTAPAEKALPRKRQKKDEPPSESEDESEKIRIIKSRPVLRQSRAKSESSLSDLKSDYSGEDDVKQEDEKSSVKAEQQPRSNIKTERESATSPKVEETKASIASNAKRNVQSDAADENDDDDDNDEMNDSDLSSLIDETPARRKRQSKDAPPSSKQPPPPPSSRKKRQEASASLVSPSAAEVKKLQAQLGKCGVRKIWGIELRQHGGDDGAKIRHLRGMLRAVGMDARYSDARARQIREERELAADLEAVTAGEQQWGLGRGGRRRSAARKAAGGGGGLKEQSASGEDETGDEDEADDGDDSQNARQAQGKKSTANSRKESLARAQLDLAFLGDEESSDDG